MKYPVIVQTQTANRYVAEPLGKSELRVEGATEAEALRRLAEALALWLNSAKLVQLEIPVTAGGTGNPWLDTFGRSADDPDFEAFMTEIEQARASREDSR